MTTKNLYITKNKKTSTITINLLFFYQNLTKQELIMAITTSYIEPKFFPINIKETLRLPAKLSHEIHKYLEERFTTIEKFLCQDQITIEDFDHEISLLTTDESKLSEKAQRLADNILFCFSSEYVAFQETLMRDCLNPNISFSLILLLLSTHFPGDLLIPILNSAGAVEWQGFLFIQLIKLFHSVNPFEEINSSFFQSDFRIDFIDPREQAEESINAIFTTYQEEKETIDIFLYYFFLYLSEESETELWNKPSLEELPEQRITLLEKIKNKFIRRTTSKRPKPIQWDCLLQNEEESIRNIFNFIIKLHDAYLTYSLNQYLIKKQRKEQALVANTACWILDSGLLENEQFLKYFDLSCILESITPENAKDALEVAFSQKDHLIIQNILKTLFLKNNLKINSYHAYRLLYSGKISFADIVANSQLFEKISSHDAYNLLSSEIFPLAEMATYSQTFEQISSYLACNLLSSRKISLADIVANSQLFEKILLQDSQKLLEKRIITLEERENFPEIFE